jgi:hypothetical protein
MPAASRAYPSKKTRVGSKAAGAGGGTLLVLVANTLPQNSPWKPWILAAAPTVTVSLSTFFTWGIGETLNYFKNKQLYKALIRAKKATADRLKTEGTSAKHKALMRRNLEELEKIEVRNEMTLVRRLAWTDEVVSLSQSEEVQMLPRNAEVMSSTKNEGVVPEKNVRQRPFEG